MAGRQSMFTEEERRQRILASKRRYNEKKKLEKLAAKQTAEANYQKMYIEECAKNKALEIKAGELEKLCKIYADKTKQATDALHKATLEYNARTRHMLDCVKHAYVSMQFAVAADDKQGGNQ